MEYDYEKPSIKIITLQLIEPPKEEELFLYPIPSFVATLLNKEKEKGTPLTEKEVLELRDSASCVALPISQKITMDESRGYEDIDMEYAWEQWQEARIELMEEES